MKAFLRRLLLFDPHPALSESERQVLHRDLMWFLRFVALIAIGFAGVVVAVIHG